ncbi:unnamed protein product [Lactuca saligna]|uniref:Uncharacterized protein n=1 Tax=Lactuca saligna TaxID=75948 RepID=A0AA36ECS5_LACSI|nr:unnamed protein product [Lactuca saligna]
MPINGLSVEPAKLPSFPYATKNGGSKNKSRRSLRCSAVILNLPTDYLPKGNNTLISRFVMSNPKPNALDSSKKGLHLLKSSSMKA